MARIRLTVTAKIFIAAVIVGVVGVVFYLNPGLLGKVAPTAAQPSSNVPPVAKLPDEVAGFQAAADAPPPIVSASTWSMVGRS